FFMPSLQHGIGLHTPPVHTLLVQSPAATHVFPSAQRGHEPPPQSTSVSVLSLTPLVHVAAVWHTLFTHCAPTQSLVKMQLLPSAHRAHDPPQLTSHWPPFFRP